MAINAVHIETLESNSGEIDFKICRVNFDKPCEIEEAVKTDLFNIIWLKEGSGKYRIDFKSYDIAAGTIFFLTPGQVYQVETEDIVSGYRLSFAQDFYCVETRNKDAACNGVLFNNIYETPFIKPTKGESNELEEIVKKIFTEFNVTDSVQQDMIDTYLKLFLIQSTRIKNKELDALEGDIDNSAQSVSLKFNDLVEKNFRKLHSVSDYADMLSITPKSLSKRIKHLKGVPPSEIIQSRIILEAKRELYYTNKTAKEIAYGLGFNDPAYFNRLFKKVSNVSPIQFKEQLLAST